MFARDANGNVLGGVRSPQVDAPIATLGGVGNSGTGPVGKFCVLFGTTVPFNASRIHALYPNHACSSHAGIKPRRRRSRVASFAQRTWWSSRTRRRAPRLRSNERIVPYPA